MNLRYNYALLAIIGLLLAACQTETNSTATDEANAFDLQRDIQGTWQTVQINVAVNSAEGLDSFRVENITENTWRQDFGVHPPKYFFQPDHKFRREHVTLQGQMMDEGEGIWNVFGDTLVLIESDATYQYQVNGDKSRVTFRTLMDWDEDGKVDDQFQSLQRKVSVSAQ